MRVGDQLVYTSNTTITLPPGAFRISAYGESGQSAESSSSLSTRTARGGAGGIVTATFSPQNPTTIKCLVNQGNPGNGSYPSSRYWSGGNGSRNCTGRGGRAACVTLGSSIYDNDNQILMIAGGGGGGSVLLVQGYLGPRTGGAAGSGSTISGRNGGSGTNEAGGGVGYRGGRGGHATESSSPLIAANDNLYSWEYGASGGSNWYNSSLVSSGLVANGSNFEFQSCKVVIDVLYLFNKILRIDRVRFH